MKLMAAFLVQILGVAPLARADYSPPALHELIGASDLVVHGTIGQVREKTFSLSIQAVLVGNYAEREVEIHRFVDWTCSSRWQPYRQGQEVIAFLQALDAADPRSKMSRYILRSAGAEGEFPVRDGVVYPHRYRVPGAPRIEGEPFGGHRFKLAVMQSAIREYRRLFLFEYDRKKWNRVRKIRVVGDPNAIEHYAKKSTLHSHLVETTRAKVRTLAKTLEALGGDSGQ